MLVPRRSETKPDEANVVKTLNINSIGYKTEKRSHGAYPPYYHQLTWILPRVLAELGWKGAFLDCRLRLNRLLSAWQSARRPMSVTAAGYRFEGSARHLDHHLFRHPHHRPS